MVDNILLKIRIVNIVKYTKFTISSFIFSIFVILFIGDDNDAILFSISILFLLIVLPVIYLLVSYIIEDYKKLIIIDKYDIRYQGSLFKIQDVKELIIYRNNTVDNSSYIPVSNMIDFYFLNFIMNDDKSIVVTCLIIPDLELLLLLLGDIKKSYVTNGVMLLDRKI